MTQPERTRPVPGISEAWMAEELQRIKKENKVRRTLVFSGLITLMLGLGAVTYLVYNDELEAAQEQPAVPTSGEPGAGSS